MRKKYKIQFHVPGFCNSVLSSLRRTLVRFVNNRANAKTVYFLLFFLCIVFFSSCTKVINVDIKNADKQLVIEGIVPYADSSLRGLEFTYPLVKISETKNFEDDNSFVGVSGATVSITVNGGTSYQMFEGSTGFYQSRQGNFLGNPGSTYQLTVMLDGKTYTATSTMPSQIVPLDSIWAEELTFAGNSNITIYPSYKDPPGLGNSYRLVEYKNGVQVKHVFEQNDELSDGLTITRPLINPDSSTLDHGDIVRVDLQCIDVPVYNYWFSLDQSATGENQSATPTNPVTNITGGALGYFSAYSVTSRTIEIP